MAGVHRVFLAEARLVLVEERLAVGVGHGDLRFEFRLEHRVDGDRLRGVRAELLDGDAARLQHLREGVLARELLLDLVNLAVDFPGRRDHVAGLRLLHEQVEADDPVQHLAVDRVALFGRHRAPGAIFERLDRHLEFRLFHVLAVDPGDDLRELRRHRLDRRRLRRSAGRRRCPGRSRGGRGAGGAAWAGALSASLEQALAASASRNKTIGDFLITNDSMTCGTLHATRPPHCAQGKGRRACRLGCCAPIRGSGRV